MSWMRARWLPSTSTFTVPSGSFSICRMFEMQPMSYMSSGAGSSFAADFCATSRMLLPASIAISIALIDFGRPTKSGITMCGKTTTSLRGRSGNCTGRFESSLPDMTSPLEREMRESGGGAPGIQAARAGSRDRRAADYSSQWDPATLGCSE